MTNTNALPSNIGTSGPSISNKALLIPHPVNAAIRCSIVSTLTPSEFANRVQSSLFTTLSNTAGINLFPVAISNLLKQIPESILAGNTTSFDHKPLCKPIPSKIIGLLTVVCKSLPQTASRLVLNLQTK